MPVEKEPTGGEPKHFRILHPQPPLAPSEKGVLTGSPSGFACSDRSGSPGAQDHSRAREYATGSVTRS